MESANTSSYTDSTVEEGGGTFAALVEESVNRLEDASNPQTPYDDQCTEEVEVATSYQTDEPKSPGVEITEAESDNFICAQESADEVYVSAVGELYSDGQGNAFNEDSVHLIADQSFDELLPVIDDGAIQIELEPPETSLNQPIENGQPSVDINQEGQELVESSTKKEETKDPSNDPTPESPELTVSDCTDDEIHMDKLVLPTSDASRIFDIQEGVLNDNDVSWEATEEIIIETLKGEVRIDAELRRVESNKNVILAQAREATDEFADEFSEEFTTEHVNSSNLKLRTPISEFQTVVTEIKPVEIANEQLPQLAVYNFIQEKALEEVPCKELLKTDNTINSLPEPLNDASIVSANESPELESQSIPVVKSFDCSADSQELGITVHSEEDSSRVSRPPEEKKASSREQDDIDFNTRYALFVERVLPGHEIYYMPQKNSNTKNAGFFGVGTLDMHRGNVMSSPFWDAPLNEMPTKSATLEAPRRHRLLPKPSVNDDHLFPDSVTPSKVEKALSENAASATRDENQYDVPFMDDDAYLPKKYRNARIDDDSSYESDYSDEEKNLLGMDQLTKTGQTTSRKGFMAINGAKHRSDDGNLLWTLNMTICGCLRRHR